MFIFIIDFSKSQAAPPTVSWIYRGNAQLNNTALSFNQDDTLSLSCRAQSDSSSSFAFSITRGSKPPSGVTYGSTPGPTFTVTYSDGGAIIYDDVQGIQAGYENFVVTRFQGQISALAGNEYLRIGVAALRQADAGTYHCSAIVFPTTTTIYTSGGLTINVYTKQGQAHSSKTSVNKLMTYSAMMLGASKLLF